MKFILTLMVAATIVLMSSNSVRAADDKKSLSGYGCVPQSGRFQADFYYVGGAIFNRTSGARFVVCNIYRDLFSNLPSNLNEVDKIIVFFNVPFGASTPFACQALVRNLNTGFVVDSFTASSFVTGFGTITLLGLNYVAANDVIYLFCQLPGKSKILGVRWEEDISTTNSTDLLEGE